MSCTHELHPLEFARYLLAGVSCVISASSLDAYLLLRVFTLSLSRAGPLLGAPTQEHVHAPTVHVAVYANACAVSFSEKR